jgi:asparaginyl-tRNA synthetase
MERIKIKKIIAEQPVSKEVLVKGWVRTKRENKNIVFIALNDGSTINNIQIVANTESISADLLKNVNTGACLSVKGMLVESPGKGQNVEIQARALSAEVKRFCL